MLTGEEHNRRSLSGIFLEVVRRWSWNIITIVMKIFFKQNRAVPWDNQQCGFRTGLTLYRQRSRLEPWNFGFKKKRDHNCFCSKNKCPDQLCNYCTADLRLCFRLCMFNYCCFLAHLSQRLTRWAYSIVVEPASVRPFTFSNIFFSETAWLMKVKFCLEHPWVRGTKVCSRDLDHMTKMAATPIYGKNHSKIFSRTSRPISTKLGV